MNSTLYRIGIHLTPRLRVHLPDDGFLNADTRAALETILSAERVRGGCFALFDETGTRAVLPFGRIRKGGRALAEKNTFFRTASVSKMVTAYAAVLLAREGKLDLDADVGQYLGFPVRHPNYPDDIITARMLLSHTSSVIDGASYLQALETAAPLPSGIWADCFAARRPDKQWEYSNFGAGLMGCVMEKAAGEPFDLLMLRLLFAPADIRASYYPQRIEGTLSDAWRLFPPTQQANFDALARQKRSLPDNEIDPTHNYLLAHGNLCITAEGLARIAHRLAEDKAAFALMRTEIAPFGERDRTLSEGLGMFIYRENGLTLYGHQGLAYGAVHGVFMDERGRGFVLLTSACSEERHGVLTKMNRALCSALFTGCGPWT